MSEEVYYEDVKSVSRDGVTVERELVCTDAGIEGTFDIESRRDGPVEVRIVDELPKYFPIDEVAFRPGEVPESGDISAGQVSVTQTVVNGAVRVQYGIIPSEPVAEVRWSEPTIRRVESAESVEPDESADGESGSAGPVAPLEGLFDGDDDPTAGAADSHGTADQDTGDSTSTESGEESTAPVTEAPGRHADAVDGVEGKPEIDGSTAAANGTGDVPAGLTRGGATDETASPGSSEDADVARRFEVRLDRLTARVEKFGAYASALEPLIDERGTGNAVIEGIERDLEDLDGRLDAVRSAVESAREDRDDALSDVHGSIDRIDEALDDVEAEVGTLEAAVDGLEGGLGDAERDIDELEDRVDGHDAAIDDVETEFDEVTGDVEAIHGDVDAVESEVAEVQGDVDAVESEVTAVENEVGAVGDDVEAVRGEVEGVESDLGALEARVDGFESELADLRESVEGVEDELSTVAETAQSVSAELDGIHDEVETLHEFRKSLAQISDVDG